MNLLEKANQFVLLFIETLRRVGLWRAWVILLVYALLHWFILYAHYMYVRPPFYGLLAPWVATFGADRAVAFTHYPQQLFYLGQYAGWAKLAISLLLEGLVLAAVARLFYQAFTGERPARPRYSPLVFWLNLVAAWLILNLLMLAVGAVLPSLAAPYINGPRRLLVFTYGVLPFAFTFVFSLLILTIPAIAVNGDHVLGAIGRSVRQFLRRPLTCFAMGFVILAVPVLLNVVTGRPAGIINSFKPELLFWLLSALLFVEMIANFLWMGVAVRFLLEPED